MVYDTWLEYVILNEPKTLITYTHVTRILWMLETLFPTGATTWYLNCDTSATAALDFDSCEAFLPVVAVSLA